MGGHIEQRPCAACGVTMWQANITQHFCNRCHAKNEHDNSKPKPKVASDQLPAHTPAPWRVKEGANSHIFDLIIEAENEEGIAFCDAENANLIASAPSLLKTLKELTDLSDKASRLFPVRVSQILTDKIALAKITIAKAEGKEVNHA